jgi:hypothetical protein
MVYLGLIMKRLSLTLSVLKALWNELKNS